MLSVADIPMFGFHFTRIIGVVMLNGKEHPLSAPINGQICRTIHESASCKAYYRFSYKDQIICEFISDRASFKFEYNSLFSARRFQS